MTNRDSVEVADLGTEEGVIKALTSDEAVTRVCARFHAAGLLEGMNNFISSEVRRKTDPDTLVTALNSLLSKSYAIIIGGSTKGFMTRFTPAQQIEMAERAMECGQKFAENTILYMYHILGCDYLEPMLDPEDRVKPTGADLDEEVKNDNAS